MRPSLGPRDRLTKRLLMPAIYSRQNAAEQYSQDTIKSRAPNRVDAFRNLSPSELCFRYRFGPGDGAVRR